MVAPSGNKRESLSGTSAEQIDPADHTSASSEPKDKLPVFDQTSGNIASDDTNDDIASSSSSSAPPLDLDPRQTVGKTMHVVSDLVNENLIAARYAALASIGLLAAYGISQTPLFFRYRTVSEIPSRLFTARKTITGRLMVCRDKDNNATAAAAQKNNPTAVTCFVRHLSPMERLLSKSWLNWLLKIHPAATLRRERPEESPHELLRVQVAGIVYPSLPEKETMSSSNSGNSLLQQISIPTDFGGNSSLAKNQSNQYAGQEWLRQLAEDRVVVKCKLLGREVLKRPALEDSAGGSGGRSKRAIPGFEERATNNTISTTQTENEEDQVAVAFVQYYPKRHPLLGADLGEHMVQSGRAVPSQDGGLYAHTATEQVVDTTKNVQTLRKDAAYMERLERAEYQACNGSYGVWMDPAYRATRTDVVEEVEFQQHAPFYRKAWRWLRR